ncbi:hypothetical protein L1887_08680 [Cichorium endivia]|nr:hypothetical protein L1887_08680 [Cichorium endivia]
MLTANNRPVKMVVPLVNISTVKSSFFRLSLINFNDINPWFTIPNNITLIRLTVDSPARWTTAIDSTHSGTPDPRKTMKFPLQTVHLVTISKITCKSTGSTTYLYKIETLKSSIHRQMKS